MHPNILNQVDNAVSIFGGNCMNNIMVLLILLTGYCTYAMDKYSLVNKEFNQIMNDRAMIKGIIGMLVVRFGGYRAAVEEVLTSYNPEFGGSLRESRITYHPIYQQAVADILKTVASKKYAAQQKVFLAQWQVIKTVSEAQALVENGSDAPFTDNKGMNPISMIIQSQSPKNKKAGDIVAYLMQQGADVNIVSKQGTTLVINAILKGDPRVAKALLNGNVTPKTINFRTNDSLVANVGEMRETALHFAIRQGWTDGVTLLLAKGADVSMLEQHFIDMLKTNTQKNKNLESIVRLIDQAQDAYVKHLKDL
jgi:hypothetical protein